jgi:hypothetical protein
MQLLRESTMAARPRISFFRLLIITLAVVGSMFAQPARADAIFCTSAFTFSFGDRLVGTNSSMTATISNCGDQPWAFTDVSIDPATGAAFHVNTSCATGLMMAPGASCSATVVFAPVVTGQTSGGLWLRNTTADSEELLTFYGRGVDAQAGTATLTFVPAVAAFGPQPVGTQSPPLTVELHNQGPAALTLSAIVLNGPQVYDFLGLVDTCATGKSIPAGNFCHMSLYFQPQATGTRLANLVIDSPQLSSLAILQVSGTGTTPGPPATTTVIEFYNAALDHYFISSLQPDIQALDSQAIPGWVRTGLSFNAYPVATAGASPVCRFYIPPAQGNSHFFSASPLECAEVMQAYPMFELESPNAMYLDLPDPSTGACPAGTIAVYRVWNARVDTNHRYLTDRALRDQMVASQGYVAEGYGPDDVAMCAPQ